MGEPTVKHIDDVNRISPRDDQGVLSGLPSIAWARSVTILVSLSLFGCGDDGRVPTYQVQGKVVFADGTPLAGGAVICLSDSTTDSLSARGNIAADGTFSLGTYEADDGAIAGKHLVAIDPPLPGGFNPDAGPAPRVIHPKYQTHDSSGLEFVVTEDGRNEVTLEVSRK